MRLITSLAMLVGAVCMTACTTSDEPTIQQRNKILYSTKRASNRSLLFHLSNKDVKWGGSDAGIMPKVEGKPAKMMLERDKEEVTPYLRRGLESKDKFAAAHVLLTIIHLEDYYPIQGGRWNRLKVKLIGDGQGSYDSSQMIELQEYWKEALAIKAAEKALNERK